MALAIRVTRHLAMIRFSRLSTSAVLVLLALLALAALAVGPLGESTARLVQRVAGHQLSALTDGKVANVHWFVLRLLRDAWWIGAGTVAGLFATGWAARRIAKRGATMRRTMALLLVLLAGIQLAGAWLAGTLLFWCLLWSSPPQNIVQFRLKELLALQEPLSTERRAFIMGSSQARAQIDENLLNKLDPSTRYTELHFPGSKPFDWLLIQDQLAKRPPDQYILYVGERDIFTGPDFERLRYFASWSRVGEVVRDHGMAVLSDKHVLYAGFGLVSPWFRYREAFQQRAFGYDWFDIPQRLRALAYREGNETPEDAFLASFAESEDVARQLETLAAFVRRARAQGAGIVLVRGRVRPDVQQRLPPTMSATLDAALRDMAQQDAAVQIVDAAELHTAESFADITHFHKEAQERFTRELMLRLH